MTSYLDLITQARLIDRVESCTTTGDVEYPGTALEVTDPDGADLFHVIVDQSGQRQVLLFAAKESYRLPLEVVEQMIAKAKETVVFLGEAP